MASREEGDSAKYGFRWFQVHVTRLGAIERPNGVYRMVRINDLDIYVSPSGRTRVFRGRNELLHIAIPEKPESASRECPICRRTIKIRSNGDLYIHGGNGSGFVCRGK